jgi:hypothetical protein
MGWFGWAHLAQIRPTLFATGQTRLTYYRNCAAAHAAGVYSIAASAGRKVCSERVLETTISALRFG